MRLKTHPEGWSRRILRRPSAMAPSCRAKPFPPGHRRAGATAREDGTLARMARRQQYVDMDEILDAIDSGGDDAPQFFLNTQNGEVVLWMDPMISGEENDFDPEEEHFEQIPQQESRDEYRAMEAF